LGAQEIASPVLAPPGRHMTPAGCAGAASRRCTGTPSGPFL